MICLLHYGDFPAKDRQDIAGETALGDALYSHVAVGGPFVGTPNLPKGAFADTMARKSMEESRLKRQ